MYKRQVLSLILFSAHAFSWGRLGHRITGQVAYENLNDQAKKVVNTLSPTESLANISNYPDFIKSDPVMRKKYNHWHYVSPTAKTSIKKYIKDNPKKENIIFGIKHFITILKNQKATPADRTFALKFLAHLVGDIHQPLHVGHAHDRGGNSVKLNWFTKKTNLHAIWDESMIQMQELSFTEYTAEIKQRFSNRSDFNLTLDPIVWAQESNDYLPKVYAYKAKKYWEYDYNYQHIEFLNERLYLGGMRLAKLLNSIL